MSVTADPRIGIELAGYRIESLIGRGGMSTVYRAEDLTLGRKVALKLISPELSEDEGFRERFRAEWRLAASIDHPNVIPIHEAGEHDGTLFIAMRYVDGTDLKQLIQEEGALEPERAVNLVSQVAEGLDAAHKRGLVHRDVKPSNVLIARDGEKEHVYLADFGLTKPASSEVAAKESIALSGSYDYVSPEQITDGTAEAASDIYGLGAVVYEALTGRVPFPYERKLQTLFAHVNDEPPRPSEVDPELPAGLDDMVATAMAKEPDDRYATGAALARAATAALPTPKRSRRQIAALVAGLALLLATAIAIPAILLTGGGEEPAPAGNANPTTHAVQRIDVRTGQLVGTIELGFPATDLAVVDDAVWLLDRSAGALHRVNPDGTGIAETVPADVGVPGWRPERIAAWDSRLLVSGKPGGIVVRASVWNYDPQSRSFSEVGSVATSDGKGSGFVPLVAGFGDVWVIEPVGEFAEVLYRFSDGMVSPTAAITLTAEEFPWGFNGVFAVDERSLWVQTSWNGPGAAGIGPGRSTVLWRIDPDTNELADVFEIPVDSSELLAIAVGAGSLWIPDPNDDAVARVDQATGAVVNEIRVGRQPLATVFANDAVWVANSRDGTVSRLDPDTLDVTDTIVGGTPTGIVATDDSVWVTVRPE